MLLIACSTSRPHHSFNIYLNHLCMRFDLKDGVAILERTPGTLYAMLHDLDDEWTNAREGEDTWNVKEVVSHLIYLDDTNWLHRAKIMLSTKGSARFEPLDRSGGDRFKDLSLSELLHMFHHSRKEALRELRDLSIDADSFQSKAIHPDFGEVHLSQLLSAWVVHDLSHISQVCRIMAKQYKVEVGPWLAYLRILNN